MFEAGFIWIQAVGFWCLFEGLWFRLFLRFRILVLRFGTFPYFGKERARTDPSVSNAGILKFLKASAIGLCMNIRVWVELVTALINLIALLFQVLFPAKEAGLILHQGSPVGRVPKQSPA